MTLASLPFCVDARRNVRSPKETTFLEKIIFLAQNAGQMHVRGVPLRWERIARAHHLHKGGFRAKSFCTSTVVLHAMRPWQHACGAVGRSGACHACMPWQTEAGIV